MAQPIKPPISATEQVSNDAALLSSAPSSAQERYMQLMLAKMEREEAQRLAQEEANKKARRQNLETWTEKMKSEEHKRATCTHRCGIPNMGSAIVVQRVSTGEDIIASCQRCNKVFNSWKAIPQELWPPIERVGGVTRAGSAG